MLIAAAITTQFGIIAGRGRGLAYLIDGMYNGDVTSWIIVGVLVVVFIGIGILKMKSSED